MADDAEPKPAPRPRRRRTDLDPTIKPPRMPGGRRRADLSPDVVLPPSPIGPGPARRVRGGRRRPRRTRAAPAIPESDGDTPTTRFLTPGAALAGVRDDVRRRAGGIGQGSWLPVLDDRSPDPGVCPFLRAVGPTTTWSRRSSARTRPTDARPCAMPCRNRSASRSWSASPRATSTARATCAARWSWPRRPSPSVQPGATVTPAVLGSLVVLVMAVQRCRSRS